MIRSRQRLDGLSLMPFRRRTEEWKREEDVHGTDFVTSFSVFALRLDLPVETYLPS